MGLFQSGILYQQWHDTNVPTIASTWHNATNMSFTFRNTKDKETKEFLELLVPIPQSFVDYNTNMGGVDLLDQHLSYYDPQLKQIK